MRKTSYLPHLTTAVLALALSSCASTKIVKSWRDPEYHAHPKKILVLVLSRSPTVKILLENQFVEQLERRGLVAVASHGLLTDDIVFDREALLVLVRDQDVDTVLITRPIGLRVEEAFRPGEVAYATGAFYSNMYDDYEMISGYVYAPGTYEEDVVSMETNIYDVRTHKRIWSALSRTFIWNTPEEVIKPEVSRLMEKLTADKIIPERGTGDISDSDLYRMQKNTDNVIARNNVRGYLARTSRR